MATKIASLYAEIGADTTKLEAGLKKSKDGMKEFNDAFKELTGVSLGAAGAIGIVTEAFKFSLDAAMHAEVVDANLNATLKSTKNAVGLTADELKRMSTEMAQQTGIGHDEILTAESMLLTFTKIGKDVFPQAIEAVTNLSSKFGSMQEASIQVGKALQDPILGVTNLRRVGVMLSDTQTQQVKDFMAVNDVAGAQKIILGELETEFGGLANAIGDTTQGRVNKLKDSLDELGENVGKELVPTLAKAVDALNILLTWNGKLAVAVDDQKKKVDESAASWEDLVIKTVQVNLAAQGTKKTYEEVKLSLDQLDDGYVRAADGAGVMDKSQWKLTHDMGDSSDIAERLKDKYRLLKDGALGVATANDTLAMSYENQLKSSMAIFDSQKQYQEQADKARESVVSLTQRIDTLSRLKTLDPDQAVELNKYWVGLENSKKAVEDLKDVSGKAAAGPLAAMNAELSKITGVDQHFKTAKDAVDAFQKKVNELSNGTYLTEDQKTQLAGLRDDLAKAKTAEEELAKANQDATNKMVFNMLLTKASSDGLTKTEFDNLIKIGTGFGIVDEKSATMASNLNAINLDDAHLELSTIYGDIRSIMGQPNEKNITVTTTYKVSGDSTLAPTKTNPDDLKPKTAHWIPDQWGENEYGEPIVVNPGHTEYYRMGGAYTVPGGHNEDWPVGPGKYASSGETVTISPAGKGGAGVTIQNVNIYNDMDLESFRRMLMQAVR